MASVAVRPTARSIALSNPIQNRLIQGEVTPEQSALARMLMIQGGIPATNALIQGAGNE